MTDQVSRRSVVVSPYSFALSLFFENRTPLYWTAKVIELNRNLINRVDDCNFHQLIDVEGIEWILKEALSLEHN